MNQSSRPSDRPSARGRRCTRSSCSANATQTLTYVYSDSTAVLGPLATFAEPHSYDLCQEHSEKLKVPQGWTVIRHKNEGHEFEPSAEDVRAIAEAVRQTRAIDFSAKRVTPEVGRRGHLRSLPKPE